MYNEDHAILCGFCNPSVCTCPIRLEVTNYNFLEAIRKCYRVDGFKDLDCLQVFKCN